MPSANELLKDGFSRVEGVLAATLSDLAPLTLEARIDPDANSISWLTWHLSRVQDDHIADVAGTQQVWTAAGWEQRFALGLASGDFGFGHTSAQVGQVRDLSATDLLGYHRAVHAATQRYLDSLNDDDFEQVVDDHWDPPVTLGVRLTSVLADNLQHAGQVAYVAGVLARSGVN